MAQASDSYHAADTYAYNLNPEETPGRLKIRWRIRIATGTEAERLDIIQQQAIINLLTWADKRSNLAEKAPGKDTEIHADNSSDL